MPISIRRINRAPSQSETRRPLPKISMPVVLQSSTNLNLHNMMDLQSAQRMMAARGSNDVMTPSTATEPELTDGSSANSSPAIEHNHLTSYFPGPAGAAARAAEPSPTIPKRVPSHSKKEHERLARKRSLRASDNGRTAAAGHSASPSISTAVSNDERTSLEMMGVSGPEPPPKTSTPSKHRSPRLDNGMFFPELEQLAEAVEDQIRSQPDVEDEDTIYMRSRGLVRLEASDYCAGIGNPFDLPAPFNAGFSAPDMGAWI